MMTGLNISGGGNGNWKESTIGDWSYRVANVGNWSDGNGAAIIDNTMLNTGDANGTGINVQIEYQPHVGMKMVMMSYSLK